MMTLAIVADRVGYEERALIDAAERHGLKPLWIDDGRLCAGPRAIGVPPADVYVIRSRSYTRSGIIAGLLEDRGARTINSGAAIDLCQSKLATLRALDAAELPSVDFRVVATRDDLDRSIESLGIPLVLKPLLGGFGRRVLLIRDPDLAHSAYDYVEHHAQSYDRVLLAQPLHTGADVRAFVIGGSVVAAVERMPTDDWRSNVATGAAASPVDVTADLEMISERTAAVTGAEILALDAFREGERLVVSEANHAPRFRGLSAATGIDIADAVVRHIAALDPKGTDDLEPLVPREVLP